MGLVKGSDRIVFNDCIEPASGAVRWKPVKSSWLMIMTLVGVVGAPLSFSWAAFSIFFVLIIITLCAGHSVGMHRLLIHNSFECPLWLEYVLVYLGVLVGMAGPIGMMRQHDLRDWAQRQKKCHDYLCHQRNLLQDYYWQCHCDVELVSAPNFVPEKRVEQDRFYQWLELYWMWQQLPLALILFAFGGWGFVVWGVALRITVSVTGHWLVGHYAHHDYRETDQLMSWRVSGASVQGRDVPIAGLISMGESWHNNHHAFPGSARLGLFDGQPDPGWWLIMVFKSVGLAWNIRLPDNIPARVELVRLNKPSTGWSICKLRKRMWYELCRAIMT